MNRDELIKVLNGERPERIPLIPAGIRNQREIERLTPPDCYDENTYINFSDDSPCDRYSPGPRTRESRERAVRMAAYLDSATIGVGKGGSLSFGHGGPGEIQAEVVERAKEHKILQYEGGHRRQVNLNPHAIRYYHFQVEKEADLDTLELPDMRDPVRFQDVEEDAKLFKASGFCPTGAIQGFFSGIHNSFMDFQATLENLLLEPDFMKRLTRMLAEMSLDAVDMMLERGIEMIEVADDLGSPHGLLISPEIVREFFLPWYEELAARVHQAGAYLHLHSHGNIESVLADLVSCGVDVINPFDWHENPDLPGLVRRFGKDIVFCGGVMGDLYLHSLEEVEFIVRRACGLSKIAERGFILMGYGMADEIDRERWNRTRKIFDRAREEL